MDNIFCTLVDSVLTHEGKSSSLYPSPRMYHKALGDYKNTPADKSKYVVFEEANFYIDVKYQITAILGKGSYGTVCQARDVSVPDAPVEVAIKKVTNIFNKEILLKRAVRELKLMKFFRGHKNIINLFDVELVFERPYDGLYCFQELADYDLARVIHSSVQFSEYHVQSFLYQILCGLKYIHSADVIHRDLKPGNILVTLQGNLKICDFGLARGISQQFLRHRSSTITNYVATRWYRAPELLLCKKVYSKAVDMWAVGCIFGELYARKPLFIGNDHIHQVHEILQVLGSPSRETVVKQFGTGSICTEMFHSTGGLDGTPNYKGLPWAEVLPYAPGKALNLLSKLLCWESSLRLSVDEVLDHPYLANVRDLDEEVNSSSHFDFSFESKNITLDDYKGLIHDEVKEFKFERMGRRGQMDFIEQLYSQPSRSSHRVRN
ncbi:Mitogen-activated protein kinase hog1 [Wickerhamomyces ciferrii]|uniref:Mitogen-activated protein kinase hog1 n=1 Tax=Wickerhamomyces ciferrii (strain ATCC 14091 / BCRC 22168 / CBS 111 / JCM 3599 / NBRC 0793 / NRRL Y-1031 F-60-10) TaxID=1206466 RepID=K0KM93_WICCF|nr:Mitogen-activated protein kinase hog1 [Wickerhamomyces ciferrii]CCH44111.1 Mitogen-activated protein kinase hog1 [Wickerhamomyces ciferrii]